MINCLFCDVHHCEWWGVDRWAESCPAHPDYDEEEDDDERANRLEWEEEQAEISMEEERAIAAVHKRFQNAAEEGGAK
jgi:hypothetical protein